jgi:FKBP-type peptidyl-prolyl cis-trans isomerase FklB
MKKIVLLMLMAGSLLPQLCAGDSSLQTQDQKASYALAWDLMQGLHKDQLTLDNQAFLQGLQDVENERAARLSPAELRKAKDYFIVKRINQQKLIRDEELVNGRLFMLDNHFKPGVTELPSGLQYKVLAEGSGERTPKVGDGLGLRFRMSDINGKELINATPNGVPKKVTLEGVMPGWQQALQLMKPGAKWQLFIPPDLAFGDKGSPDGLVSPNQTLVFDMELVDFVSAEAAKVEMDTPIVNKISENQDK